MIKEVYLAIKDKNTTVENIQTYLKIRKIQMSKTEIKAHISVLKKEKYIDRKMNIIQYV